MSVVVTHDPDGIDLSESHGLLDVVKGVITGSQELLAYGWCTASLPDIARSYSGTTTYDIELPRLPNCACELHINLTGKVDVYANARWVTALSGLFCYVGGEADGKLTSPICDNPAEKGVVTGSMDVPVKIGSSEGGAETVVRVSKGPITKNDAISCRETSNMCKFVFAVSAAGSINASTGSPLSCKLVYASAEVKITHSARISAFQCADARVKVFEWSTKDGYTFQTDEHKEFVAARHAELGIEPTKTQSFAARESYERIRGGIEKAFVAISPEDVGICVRDVLRREFLQKLKAAPDLAERLAAFEREADANLTARESSCTTDIFQAVRREML